MRATVRLQNLDGDTLAVTVGIYLRETYVERFGQVSYDEVAAIVREAGAGDRYDPRVLREITKLVVARPYRGLGLSRYAICCAHSTGFMDHAGTPPPLVVYCAKHSITRNIYEASGFRTRTIKPFPLYKVHELYRSASDPMDSRLIIPALDIPERWYNLTLPAELEVDEDGALARQGQVDEKRLDTM